MAVDQMVALDLDDLPIDLFELADQGLTVESLTAGHGTTEMVTLCSCCCCLAYREHTRDELAG
jgi:hypothetical protein